MKLYTSPFAPNAMRVLIVMREKNVEAEIVDIADDRPGYVAINPLRQVPALVRDDGSILTESLTIAQYIDAVSGAPFLFGDDAEERFRIAMWERRAEMGLFNPAIEYGHHVHPMFARWMAQFPDYAASLLPKAQRTADVFAAQLDGAPYVAGNRFTAADVTAFLGWFNLIAYGAIEPGRWPSFQRWSAEILARDSMAPVREVAAAFNIPL